MAVDYDGSFVAWKRESVKNSFVCQKLMTDFFGGDMNPIFFFLGQQRVERKQVKILSENFAQTGKAAVNLFKQDSLFNFP